MKMRHDSIIKLLIFIICIFLIIPLSAYNANAGGFHIGWGSVSIGTHPNGKKKSEKDGPPSYAPAHGYRAKYAYHYYPDSRIYFDVDRNVYFYLEGDNWRMSVSLPEHIQVHLTNHVTIEMDSDKPYTQFEDHYRKYPPGQLKKKAKLPKWK
jgi:hypothetical protein